MNEERMNIVIVGHVDHGKSTVIGRLLADTNSLPKGKLEQVKAMCIANSKPFEYAFLLDALKDEQSQGITIDSARCFFHTQKRHYIVIDAPGHIEFLKNMVTGAARAEAALLVIDADEGIQENSKRHGYLLSMLGIKQVCVLVNKMDLVDYDPNVFQTIQEKYNMFLKGLNITASSFIPISAREGENIVTLSSQTSWYQGLSVLEQLDAFQHSGDESTLPFRFPLQDIYKFTENEDDRRIFTGTIETGCVEIGDEVTFFPSGKKSSIQSIESFNTPVKTKAFAGEAIGFTLSTQVYLNPGEMMVREKESSTPQVSLQFKANIFWMGKAPLIQNKNYKLKLATTQRQVKLVKIVTVLDALELDSSTKKEQVDRHDVAECIFETAKPIAFDLISEIESTGRFVLVDNYEIAGGGIILEAIQDEKNEFQNYIQDREFSWDHGEITPDQRASRYQHQSKFILFTGPKGTKQQQLAKALEKRLFEEEFIAYYMSMNNFVLGLHKDMDGSLMDWNEQVRKLGELARIMTDAGQIFITTAHDMDDYDVKRLCSLNEPNEVLVINVGENRFNHFKPNVQITEQDSLEQGVEKVYQLLKKTHVLEYYL